MMKHKLKIALALTAAFCLGRTAQAQTPSSPALAASWSFMQQQMKGVPESLLESACKEGTVMVYYGTWTDAEDAQIAQFEKRFPCINVQKFTADTGQRRQRWVAEVNAKRDIADIVQDTDPGFLNQQAKLGHLMDYKISNDADFTDATKNTGYWYPQRAALVGIAWNTDLVTPAEAAKLQTWQGITDPIWAGRAAVVDPSAGGVAYLPWYIWLKNYGPDFLQKIGALKPRIIAAVVPAGAALASGDIAVLFNASETGLLPLLAKGAPIRWSLPNPGIGPMTGQAIAAEAPHPDAAKLFQEYAFTAEGYSIWQKLGGAPVRVGLKDSRPVAQQSWYKIPTSFFPYDPADASKSTNAVMDAYHKYVGNAR